MSTPSPEQPRGSEVRQSVTVAAERIQEILDTAERMAQEIRRDAESEAAAYLAEKRREADALVAARVRGLERARVALEEQLKQLDAQGTQMIRTVEAALRDAVGQPPATQLSAVPSPPPRSSPEPAAAEGAAHREERSTAPPGPTPDSRTPSAPPAGPQTPSPPVAAYPGTGLQEPSAPAPGVGATSEEARESALIRATQMAIGGSDRAEIESTLRAEFSIADPSGVVDEIFGTE